MLEVIKSPSDDRDIRYLLLPNRLKVILISDPQTEKSAASLCVWVGAAYDPLEYQGLAHFCEHMLFMGTSKFPKENEYSDFISKNQGSENAYTTYSNTCYSFDISNDAFEEALD